MPLTDKAESIAAQFEFSDEDVRKCCAHFIRELEAGLRERTAAVCQIPTYVTKVATGMEKGLALAVDLGGTNLRVCSVYLLGNGQWTAQSSKITIPTEIMTAPKATSLFSFIARQIECFLDTHHKGSTEKLNDVKTAAPLCLGFTFSYPAYQTGINSGILLRWTKGFDIADAIGQNVCQLLQEAIDKLQLPVKVTALVNDALGALMFRAYTLSVAEERTSVGTIFGTGTNGVYLEKLSNISKPLDGAYDTSTGEMFISCEWGSFDNGLLVQPNTVYDARLDEVSVNPGNQMFEKRVSGMFLGELLRTTLYELYKDPEAGLFGNFRANHVTGDTTSIPFFTRWAVDTSVLSIAEADDSNDLVALRKKTAEALCIPHECISVADAQAVKVIANTIGKRAARLAGTALASVILKGDRLVVDPLTLPADGVASQPRKNAVDIAVDGSVIEFYPGFERYMRETWRVIEGIGPCGEEKIKIGIAKDGSSIGAAIVALVAAAQQQPVGPAANEA